MMERAFYAASRLFAADATNMLDSSSSRRSRKACLLASTSANNRRESVAFWAAMPLCSSRSIGFSGHPNLHELS
jgi:hypothetical protein